MGIMLVGARRKSANIVCFLVRGKPHNRLDGPESPVFACLARNMLGTKHQQRSNEMAFTEKDMQAQEEQLNALKRMSGIHLAIPVFSKGYRPKQGKVAP